MTTDEARLDAAPTAPTAARPSTARPAAAQAPRISDADLPARPTLAPGVELSGQMEDSAYEDQPWLILREDGGFVQVSQLLYRLAEACDGRRDHAQLAARLSEVTARSVSEDNVRQLLRERLVPLGVVPRADGSVVPTAAGPRSPLQVNLRTARISPRLIEPLAHLLKPLFHPLLVVPILAIGLAALGWVFLLHGLGESLRGAVYEPWLVLVLLPIIVASAAFHELGHAAALAYAGGKVRGMGAGFYLFYPVFYTDVTDNYRLARWSRVRTDLGGFHFNLVFALLVTGAYLLTGQAVLLLAVLAIAFSIVHQAIPVMRLDGYWALADITGIPDPISQMKPFFGSLLPGWRGPRPAPMKTWVKVVFVAYVLITVPLLLLLTVYMLRAAPRIIGTAIDSVGRQLAALQAGLTAGDAVAVAGPAVGLLVLALTTGGFVYFIYKVGRGVLGRLWSWGSQGPSQRALASVASVGLLAFVAWLWLPPLPTVGNQPGPFGDYRPIEQGESLTLPQGVGFVPGPPVPGGSPSASPSASPGLPGAGATAPPDGGLPTPAGVTPVPSAPGGATAAPTADPGTTPGPGATPTPSPTPSPTPTLAP